MNKQILTLTLLFLTTIYPPTKAMEQSSFDRDKQYFTCFSELPIELQKMILFEFRNAQTKKCSTTFQKIIESYKSIKFLSGICKPFYKFETEHMLKFREDLEKEFVDTTLGENIIFENLINLKAHTDNNKDLIDLESADNTYELIIRWLCEKEHSQDVFKAALIIWRLNHTNLSETNALKKIWSQLENEKTGPLHIACKTLNVGLVKYLLNPIIRSYFQIDINAQKLSTTALQSLPKKTKKNATKMEEIKKIFTEAIGGDE